MPSTTHPDWIRFTESMPQDNNGEGPEVFVLLHRNIISCSKTLNKKDTNLSLYLLLLKQESLVHKEKKKMK